MKTTWMPLRGNYEQIKFDNPKFLSEEEIKKLLLTRFNLADFASMVASMTGLLSTDKKIECIMIRDEISKHPKLTKHFKAKYLITIHFLEEGTETFLPIQNLFAIELQNNPTIEDVEDIIRTYFATPNIFVAFYCPQRLSSWMLTVDAQDGLGVKYAADLAL